MYRRDNDAHGLEEGNPTPSIRRFFCMLSPKKPIQKQSSPRRLQVPQLPPSQAPVSSLMEASSSSSEFSRVFRYFDENGDGKISPMELRNSCMRTAGTELSAEDAEAAVGYTDSDGDGLLGLEDFVKLVEVEEEEDKGRSLKDAFGAYATEEDGQDYITAKSLKRALRRLGESKSTDECKVMIRCFDLNGDGVLSFEEFRLMML
ncbi:putative calcium-binding protein CML19 [Iris pallida]|uniref:Calcium-binding protein CML19 n=1 Tax=Iris pallida TaxID=29817 RepID=A0AAX6H4R6_IRIPA|nr:putative calcium-binding protein CML19 [Iris pallida]KAJ6835628.1 putative calcium-binding protein CML19 [Iris pallida]